MRNTTTPKGTRLAHRIGLQRRAAECSYWVLGLAVLSSCTLIQERYALPVDAQTSATIMQTLQEREATVSSLKGLFHADIKGQGISLLDQSTARQHRKPKYPITTFSSTSLKANTMGQTGALWRRRVTHVP